MNDLPNVKGLAELTRTFQGIVGETRKRVLRRGASAGARYMRSVVKAATPIGKGPKRRKGQMVPRGNLRNAAFYFFDRRDSNENQATFRVTFRKKTGFYASWVDGGHPIVPRHGKGLGPTLRHRRMNANRQVPPHPFFEAAVTSGAERTLEVEVAAMDAELKKIISEKGAA